MDVRYGALQEPKPGASASQCEDAIAYSDTHGLAAVCDGASSGFESRLWARLLARGFVADSPLGQDADLLGWVDSVAAQWSAAIPWPALDVFQQAKAREGSASTLVGLELTPSPQQPTTGTWRCLALGDSCLFQVSGGELTERLPVGRSSDFSLRTPLLYTERDTNRRNVSDVVRSHGTWQQGDCFFLLTDAVAQWFLSEEEQGGTPWTTLMSLDEEGFPAFVKEKQAQRQMRQDDATALMIGLGIPLATSRMPALTVVTGPQPATEPKSNAEPGPRSPTPVLFLPPPTPGDDGESSPAAGQAAERFRRRRALALIALAALLTLACAIATLAHGFPGRPSAPPVPAVQPAAQALGDLVTTYPGGGADGYRAYEAKLAGYVLDGNPAVVARLAGSDSPPPSFTSKTTGVTVAVVHSGGTRAQLYVVAGQQVTVAYSYMEPVTCQAKAAPARHTCYASRSAVKDVSRQLLIYLIMIRQGQRWLVSDAHVQLMAGQAAGALVAPAATP